MRASRFDYQSNRHCTKTKTTGAETIGFDRKDFHQVGNEWRDLFAHDVLARNGHKIVARPADAPDGYKNIDLFMDGKLWEVKSPQDEPNKEPPKPGNELKFVSNCLSAASKQFGGSRAVDLNGSMERDDAVRVVINTRYKLSITDEAVGEKIRAEISKTAKKFEVIHIGKDGVVSYYSN